MGNHTLLASAPEGAVAFCGRFGRLREQDQPSERPWAFSARAGKGGGRIRPGCGHRARKMACRDAPCRSERARLRGDGAGVSLWRPVLRELGLGAAWVRCVSRQALPDVFFVGMASRRRGAAALEAERDCALPGSGSGLSGGAGIQCSQRGDGCVMNFEPTGVPSQLGEVETLPMEFAQIEPEGPAR